LGCGGEQIIIRYYAHSKGARSYSCCFWPYQYIRHPGYLGAIIFYLAALLLLGSFWAYIPVGIYVIVVIIRTSLEDHALQEELKGYQSYAQDVG
jgi:protein-S-isoprenylcysteine O-methyltransferase Ste14